MLDTLKAKLEARTAEALASVARLSDDINAAFDAAEREAEARIADATRELEAAIAVRMAAFEARVAQAVARAHAAAHDAIGADTLIDVTPTSPNDDVTVAPADDQQRDEQTRDSEPVPHADDNGMSPACDTLYERRGRGRNTRYVPVDEPRHGKAYYRKDGDTWTEVLP